MNGLKLWIPLVPLLIAGALGAGSRSTTQHGEPAKPGQRTVATAECQFAFGCPDAPSSLKNP